MLILYWMMLPVWPRRCRVSLHKTLSLKHMMFSRTYFLRYEDTVNESSPLFAQSLTFLEAVHSNHSIYATLQDAVEKNWKI